MRWIQNLQHATEVLGDPDRLVHIGDRESDIYEFFCAANAVGSHFLVRTCVNRLAEDGAVTIQDVMAEVEVKGQHRIEVVDKQGNRSEAILELRYRRIRVLPPIGKQSHYPPLELSVLHAVERGEPQGRERIEWKLLTDLPIQCRQQAVECLRWYALRWRVETFFKILKTGCRPEELRLRTAERLANAIAVHCILAWRIFWMTMTSREDPKAPAEMAFTEIEQRILDRLVPGTAGTAGRAGIALYITKLARLGGFLARSRDGQPGNTVVWRGLMRLTDIQLGFAIGAEDVGN